MICFWDFGSADAPTWVAMHPPGLDASAEALGTTSKKGEKSATNECESYYPPSSELIHFQQRERMIHSLLLEMIALTDFTSSALCAESEVRKTVERSSYAVALKFRVFFLLLKSVKF